MLILLPPSEGKAAPRRRGTPLDLDRLSHPELADTRRDLLTALAKASDQPDAFDVLGVSPGLADEVRRNTELLDQPTRRAAEVYTGVLFDALDFASLSATGRRRANGSVLVQSALFGPVRPNDRICAYRLSMGVSLPGVGSVGAVWRSVLDPVMTAAAGRGPVVDCRSSTYAAAWRPKGEVARRTVAVRVFTETAGKRTVVSHNAKHTRGLVTRWLLEADRVPGTVAAVAETVAGHAECELVDLGTPSWALDVILPG